MLLLQYNDLITAIGRQYQHFVEFQSALQQDPKVTYRIYIPLLALHNVK
jgi:hypothetical protein